MIACYLGYVTQAISSNFTPLLFLTFISTYGITLDKIALIPLVFYLAQLLIDLAATKYADKIGYRACVVASQVLSAVGLILMAILPEVLPVPFIGILISVVLYAMGSGLVEVLVSPTLVGNLAEMAGVDLKLGLLVATVFPVVLVFGLIILKKKVGKACAAIVHNFPPSLRKKSIWKQAY